MGSEVKVVNKNKGVVMRCLSCNEALSDREANRKYLDWKNISNTEERYIGLCDNCLRDSDLFYLDESDPELDGLEEGE